MNRIAEKVSPSQERAKGKEDLIDIVLSIKDKDALKSFIDDMFIARGRNDGLTKRGLADVLIDQAGVKNEDIRDIQVMEDFSFINAPYDAAEHILRVFGKSRNGEKPIITKARKDDKPKKKNSESSQKKETASKPSKEKYSTEKKKEKNLTLVTTQVLSKPKF